MVDEGRRTPSGWVAPGDRRGIVAGPSAPPVPPTYPPPSPAALLPPPVPHQLVPARMGAPTPPPRRGLPWWAWLLIAIGAALVVLVAVFAIIAVGKALDSPIVDVLDANARGSEPAITGPAGVHKAIEPIECPTECLSVAGTWSLGPRKADVADYGLTERTLLDAAIEPFSSEDAFNEAIATWGSDSRDCVFINAYVPVSVSPDEPLAERAQVDILGTWSDVLGTSSITVGSGFFGESNAAEEHIARIAESISECGGYVTEDSEGDPVSVSMVPAPVLESLDASIASVGWIEDSVLARYYVYELQRGEVVARVTIATAGLVSQDEAEQLTGVVAEALAEQPTLGE